jgi:hypothetical protein
MQTVPAILAAAALLLVANAGAGQPGGTCRDDIEKLCPGTPPGGTRLMQCLTKNHSRLSAGCAEKLREIRESAAKEWEPCRQDREKFCRDANPEGGRLARCMQDNSERLSKACRTKMAEARASTEKRHPCLNDIERLCANVQPGEGRMDQCLGSHEAELSPLCSERRRLVREHRKKAPGTTR